MAPPINALMAAPILVLDATGLANGITTATVAAPTDNVRNTIVVFGFRVSAQAAPAATVAVLFKQAANTVATVQMSATTPIPLVYDFPSGHPYVAPPGTVSVVVPALGGTTISSVQILYMILPT